MPGELEGKKVAIVVTDGFEQVELTSPKEALERAGAICSIVSPKDDGHVKGWKFKDWGDVFPVDVLLANASVEDFDALLLPGGVISPDKLRVMPEMRQLVSDFFEAGKPIAAICHGPWSLIDAGVVEGRRVTSWPSLEMDLVNAGAHWVNEEVVVDDGLVTSRKPDDLAAFNAKVIQELAAGLPGGASVASRPKGPRSRDNA